MELSELLDGLKNKYYALNNTIKAQETKVAEMGKEMGSLRSELAQEKSRYGELQKKWNRMQKLVRGAGNE